MADLSGTDLPNATQWIDITTANTDLRTQVWSELVIRDAREKNVLKQFFGPEKSGKPICEKSDLKKGGSDRVTFTTVAPIRGQGVLGENVLKGNTAAMRFGTFNVQVDLLRHAVSYTQVLQLLRFTGQTLDQLSAELMGEWYGRKEQDDVQIVLRNTALRVNSTAYGTGDANLVRVGSRSDRDDITLEDTLDTTVIEESKQLLTSLGADYIGVDVDIAGNEVPQYLLFGPDYFTKGLRRSGAYLQQIREASVRDSTKNELFTGKIPLWDNNLIFSHQVKVDTALGRQGSPLAPIAFLGAPLASGAATTITGGGAANSAGGNADDDFFAYFRGYTWQIVNGDTSNSDDTGETWYAIIYNIGTDRKYEVISWTAGGNDGNELTVTREVDGDSQKTDLTAADRYSNVHPTGAQIIPCNKFGVPIGYGLHMGGNALFHARGSVNGEVGMEQINHYDDFANMNNQAHLTATGVQTVRGMSAYKDTNARYPNFMVVEGAIDYPGVELVTLPA